MGSEKKGGKFEVSYLKMIASGNLRYRFVSQGLDLELVEKTLNAVKKEADWLPVWMKVGDMFQQWGEEALNAKHPVSAGEFFMKATLAYHWAQFLHFHDLEGKERAQQAKVSVYAKARPLLDPPIQPMEVSFEGVSMPVEIRYPAGRGPHPAVIFVDGTDSTKEENYVVGNSLLVRGLAVVSFDGPGQGEVWPHMKMRPDFYKAISAVADAVCQLPEIDKNRLTLLGKSFGGLTAPAAAAHDSRFKACVANGGYFDMSMFDWNDPLRAIRFKHVIGAKSVEAAKEASKEFTLAPCIRQVKVPLLVIHGGLASVPVAAAKRIADEAGGMGTFMIFPEGIHCTHNISYKVNPFTADWLADHS